jgi:general secretion pathway protein G
MKKGFSLIEILVVVTIIGLLASVGIVTYTQFIKSSRDAARKGDLENIRGALELYRSQNNKYPPTLATLIGTPKYMNSLPIDPIAAQSYRYNCNPSPACTDYVLGALFEVTLSTCGTTPTTKCKSGIACNYCLNALGKN